MAGALKKTMIYLGLADGEEQYEEEQRAAEQPRRQERAERHAAAETAEPADDWEDEVREDRPRSSGVRLPQG